MGHRAYSHIGLEQLITPKTPVLDLIVENTDVVYASLEIMV